MRGASQIYVKTCTLRLALLHHGHLLHFKGLFVSRKTSGLPWMQKYLRTSCGISSIPCGRFASISALPDSVRRANGLCKSSASFARRRSIMFTMRSSFDRNRRMVYPHLSPYAPCAGLSPRIAVLQLRDFCLESFEFLQSACSHAQHGFDILSL